jgi:hypothetical protein
MEIIAPVCSGPNRLSTLAPNQTKLSLRIDIRESRSESGFEWAYKLRFGNQDIAIGCGTLAISEFKNPERAWLHVYGVACEWAETHYPDSRVLIQQPAEPRMRVPRVFRPGFGEGRAQLWNR